MSCFSANAFGKTSFPATVKKQIDVLVAGGVAVNCVLNDGKIYPALSPVATACQVPEGLVCAGYSFGTGGWYAYSDGKEWYSSDGCNYTGLFPHEARSPFLIEHRDGDKVQTLLFGDKSVTVSDCSGTVKTVPYGGNLACGVMRCGRLFGADSDDGYKLRWSGEGGALDWEEKINGAGWVLLRPELGEILNVAEFGERVIVLRRHGITVFSAYGSPENFKVESNVFSLSEIVKDTVQTVCCKLLFFRADGFSEFEGEKINYVSHNTAGEFLHPVCSAATSKYYLAGGVSKAFGNAVFCYDAARGQSFLIDAPAEKIVAGDRIFCYFNGACNELVNGGEFVFTGNEFNFGTAGKKTLKKLVIEGSGKFNVTLSNGSVTRTFNGVNGDTRPNMCGRSFKITVRGGGKVTALRAEAEVINGV